MSSAPVEDAAGLVRDYLERTLGLAADLLDTRASRPQKVLALGALAVAYELGSGVVSELDARRGGNAMRLARHLFEQHLQCVYVLADPEPRIEQMLASEVRAQLDIARKLNALGRMPAGKRREFLDREKAAKKRDAAAKKRRGAGQEVTASEWGFLPSRRVMARAVNGLADYDELYPGASWYSHPGISTSESFLALDEQGRIHVSTPSGDADQLAQAGALALMPLVDLVRRANWVLGPIANLAHKLDAVVRDASERLSVRVAPGRTPRLLV